MRKIGTEYLLFGGAALISLVAFTVLILVPAIGSFGRAWEKATAAFLSVFVLAALIVVGIALGVVIVYFWDDITAGSAVPGLERPSVDLEFSDGRRSRQREKTPAKSAGRGALEALSEAIESGAGLPAVARAAAKALGASVALIDRSSAVLAVAAASSAEESEAALGEPTTSSRSSCGSPTRVVGELRYRAEAAGPSRCDADGRRPCSALELERVALAGVGERRGGRRLRPRGARRARSPTAATSSPAAAELGAELEHGAGVLVARAAPRSAQTGDWRERVLIVALRALRAGSPGSIADLAEDDERAEVRAIVPGAEPAQLERAPKALERELAASLPGFTVTVAHSRWIADPADLYRAGRRRDWR